MFNVGCSYTCRHIVYTESRAIMVHYYRIAGLYDRENRKGERGLEKNYDCVGSVLKEWNGVGDSSVHSSPAVACAPSWNSGVDVKNCGTAHGLDETSLPLANMS